MKKISSFAGAKSGVHVTFEEVSPGENKGASVQHDTDAVGISMTGVTGPRMKTGFSIVSGGNVVRRERAALEAGGAAATPVATTVHAAGGVPAVATGAATGAPPGHVPTSSGDANATVTPDASVQKRGKGKAVKYKKKVREP